MNYLKKMISTLNASLSGENRVAQLDGLRGLLALQVVYLHFAVGFDSTRIFSEQYFPILINNWLAVDIFFAMSGFVMCYVYAERFRAHIRWGDYWNFILARFARIYPVNLLSIALLLIFMLPVVWNTDRFLSYDGRYSWHSAIASLFLLQGPAIDHRTWNFPSWSVSVEWVLYFIFPFFIPLLRQKYLAIVALPILGLLSFALYTTVGPVTNGPLSLVHGLLLFMSGVAIHELSKSGLFSSTVLLAATVAALVVLASYPALEMFAVFLVPLLVLTIIENKYAKIFLSMYIFRLLGLLSYSLYMLHALVAIIVMGRVHDVLERIFGDSVFVSFGVIAICMSISLLIAALSVVFVEGPFRTKIRRLFDYVPSRSVAKQQLSS
jgi:peptidoglycan/LPS O-acetylase OafA/YrhL